LVVVCELSARAALAVARRPESDLRSVGMAMVRGGIDLYVVMIAWEAASLII
jgi:uncharacterized protein YjeT (DUF2065 family)